MAQSSVPQEDFDRFTVDEASQATIAFVNIASVPGVGGASFRIRESGRRSSDLIRSSLGFGAEFTLKKPIFNGFWGADLGLGDLEDTLFVASSAGQPFRLDLDRDLLSLRGSGGLAFPISEHFKLRPYLSLIGARLDTDARISSAPGERPEVPIQLEFDSTNDSYTVAGTLEAIYDRWFDQNRIELMATYTDAYTDVFSADQEQFEQSGWNSTLVLSARWSGPTDLVTAKRPWRWNAYGNYTNFVDQSKIALGFRYYYEFGVGIDYEWNLKPLDMFGLRFVGLKAGFITGDDVTGYSVGLTFR